MKKHIINLYSLLQGKSCKVALAAMPSVVLIFSLLFFVASCEPERRKTCNVDNPLTDLLWLKEIVNNAEENTEGGYGSHVRIYQCNYRDGIGFSVEMCVDCPDAGYGFCNCEGVVLCGGGGISGADNCPEFNIDFENKKLIWEINN